MTPANLPLAAEIAAIPEQIRGYGHVKARHLAEAQQREDALLARWRDGAGTVAVRIAAE